MTLTAPRKHSLCSIRWPTQADLTVKCFIRTPRGEMGNTGVLRNKGPEAQAKEEKDVGQDSMSKLKVKPQGLF